MPRREKTVNTNGFVFFDVLYEDGARSSNRKVPSSELAGAEGDTLVKLYVEAQDRKIAEVGGRSHGVIKSVVRSRPR